MVPYSDYSVNSSSISSYNSFSNSNLLIDQEALVSHDEENNLDINSNHHHTFNEERDNQYNVAYHNNTNNNNANSNTNHHLHHTHSHHHNHHNHHHHHNDENLILQNEDGSTSTTPQNISLALNETNNNFNYNNNNNISQSTTTNSTISNSDDQNKLIHLDPVPNFKDKSDIKPWLQKIFYPMGIEIVIERSDSTKVVFKCKASKRGRKPRNNKKNNCNTNNGINNKPSTHQTLNQSNKYGPINKECGENYVIQDNTNSNTNNNTDNTINSNVDPKTKKKKRSVSRFNVCPFRIRATYSLKRKKWSIVVINNIHSHPLDFNPDSDEYKKFKLKLREDNDLVAIKKFDELEYRKRANLPITNSMIPCECGLTNEVESFDIVLPNLNAPPPSSSSSSSAQQYNTTFSPQTQNINSNNEMKNQNPRKRNLYNIMSNKPVPCSPLHNITTPTTFNDEYDEKTNNSRLNSPINNDFANNNTPSSIGNNIHKKTKDKRTSLRNKKKQTDNLIRKSTESNRSFNLSAPTSNQFILDLSQQHLTSFIDDPINNNVPSLNNTSNSNLIDLNEIDFTDIFSKQSPNPSSNLHYMFNNNNNNNNNNNSNNNNNNSNSPEMNSQTNGFSLNSINPMRRIYDSFDDCSSSLISPSLITDNNNDNNNNNIYSSSHDIFRSDKNEDKTKKGNNDNKDEIINSNIMSSISTSNYHYDDLLANDTNAMTTTTTTTTTNTNSTCTNNHVNNKDYLNSSQTPSPAVLANGANNINKKGESLHTQLEPIDSYLNDATIIQSQTHSLMAEFADFTRARNSIDGTKNNGGNGTVTINNDDLVDCQQDLNMDHDILSNELGKFIVVDGQLTVVKEENNRRSLTLEMESERTDSHLLTGMPYHNMETSPTTTNNNDNDNNNNNTTTAKTNEELKWFNDLP